MKKRILSLVVTLIVAVSVILGVSIFASADNTDGLKQSAISLAENVTLKMEVAVAAPTEGAYAKITLPGGKVDATQLVATAPKNGDNYVFTAEVAVKDLAKNVTIEICDKDGATLVAPATTTALAYCNAYTEGEFLGLVGALKAYANAADYYFDYNKTADEAAEADFSAVADVATTGKLPAGLTHRSATLLLESETTIRHYFELAEGKKIENYVFFIDENANGACDAGEKVVPASKTTSDEKTVYYVDIAGITPNELDKVYTVGVIGVADGVAYTCDYGVLTYAKRVYANDAVDTKNLAAALLGYNTEAGKLTGTVKFVTDGSAVADMSYEYGVKAPINAASTKAGAEFAGWVDANGNKVDAIPGSATGEITLTAKWAVPFTKVAFDGATQPNGGRFYCYNHIEGENNKCPTCKFCYENEDCVGKTTACAACGKKDISAGGYSIGTWGSSGSDKWVGYAHNTTTTSGAPAQLLARVSGTAYLGAVGSTVIALGKDVFAFTVELGLPNAEQIAEVEKNPTAQISGNARVLWRLVYNNADNSGGLTYNFLYINNGNISFSDSATATGIKAPTGDLTKVTVLFDFSGAIKGDGVADAFTMHLIDEDGKIVDTKRDIALADIEKFNRNNCFAQARLEGGTGRVLVGKMAQESYNENVIFADGALIPYTPGEVTAIPAPAAKDGYVFGGWYSDAALTQPIDAVAANVTGAVKVYPRWIQAAVYEEFNYAEDTTIVASKVWCDHVDADTNGICDKAECKRCLKHVDADVKDTEGYGFCDVCGYKTARCGNAAGHHYDYKTLDGQGNNVGTPDSKCDNCGMEEGSCIADHTYEATSSSNANCKTCGKLKGFCIKTHEYADESKADLICDVCGLSNQIVGSRNITANAALVYDPSAEWNTGYAKGVADDNGGYLVIAREYGDGPTFSYNGGHTLKNLVANRADKVVTYEFEIKANGNANVLGLDCRYRPSGSAAAFMSIRATTNGYTLNDEFVKVAAVVDFDAKEIRYYADGLYVSSSALTFTYDQFTATGIGVLQMRLSGTGSICFDSVGIYAGDLYRIDAKAAPACEHVDADDNLECDKCSKEFDDGCDFHADKDDDGKCDKCENVAFRDGDEAIKAAANLNEFSVPVTSKYTVPGTLGYGLANGHKIVYNDEYKSTLTAVIDLQGTDFDTVSFKISQSSIDGNDPWVCFAFVTEMPASNELIKYAEGYSTCSFKTADCTVAIPADAKYIIFYQGKTGAINFYPDVVTLKKEETPLDKIQAAETDTYEYPLTSLVPSLAVINYYRNENDPTKHLFIKDSGKVDGNTIDDAYVAFIDITGCEYDAIALEVHNRGSKWVGWTFLTEMPEYNTVVSYAEGYKTVDWTNVDKTVEIPEDAKYLVIYYQDAYSPAAKLFYPDSITFIKNAD